MSKKRKSDSTEFGIIITVIFAVLALLALFHGDEWARQFIQAMRWRAEDREQAEAHNPPAGQAGNMFHRRQGDGRHAEEHQHRVAEHRSCLAPRDGLPLAEPGRVISR